MLLWPVVAFSQAVARAPENDFTRPYAALLAAHTVRGEVAGIPATLVDFSGWAADARHGEAMQALLASRPEMLKGAAATAFWLNAYHLLLMDRLLAYPDATRPEEAGEVGENPWQHASWPIGGRHVTLWHIREEMLSPKTDMRLLFARWDGGLCHPDLPPQPYRAEGLEDALEARTRQFLSDPAKGVNDLGKVLEISALLRPYTAWLDTKPEGMVGFLRRYRPDLPPNARVQGYLPCDSSLSGSR